MEKYIPLCLQCNLQCFFELLIAAVFLPNYNWGVNVSVPYKKNDKNTFDKKFRKIKKAKKQNQEKY